MKEFPRKFLSIRDKNGSHRRSKSVPPGHKDKSRPKSSETFRALFKMDALRPSSKSEDDENDIDPAKVDDVQRRLERMHITHVTNDYIRNILETNVCDGDPALTASFIELEQRAATGYIVPYNPSVHFVGAENRGAVTCYLDALFFAMFAKLDAFECMLKTEFPADDPKAKLVTLLRIWVNMLRSGKLIRTDLTKLLQETLGDCGWPDARELEQQDTSEAFAFLTETLQLPLLSLQVDLFHQGKKDKDDHKVVYERLLNLAVPPDPDGKGIKLEDCLEEYFNARVDVLRDHEEAKRGSVDDKGAEDPALAQQNAIRLIRSEEGRSASISASPVDLAASQQLFGNAMQRTVSQASTFAESIGRVQSRDGPSTENESQDSAGAATSPPSRPSNRTRSTSVIQRVVVDEHGRPTRTEDGAAPTRMKRKGSTVVKAVTIPAWQFFRLIPWHALTPNEPKNDDEVALNFDQRPVVGICLKRYAMTESGQPQRHNTFIDIPDSLRLPHFMLAGGPKLDEELNGLSTEYKLVLQSVVCHRGDSLQSGHYIAFARIAPKLLIDNRRHDFDPPPDYEEAQWVKFDDLETEDRVTYVDDVKQALREEMPYLLFYQIVPMVDGQETEPPSYNDAKTSFDGMSGSYSSTEAVSGFGRLTGNHRHDLQATEGFGTGFRSKPPSIRLSAEMDRPSRGNIDRAWATSHTSSTPNGSRRESLAYTESPAATPGANSPVLSPLDETFTSSSRLSRAASRFALGRQSRPTSQSGEGRISFSMTRLGGLMKSSKEPLVDSNNGLQISASNSTGPMSSDASNRAPDSPVEAPDKQLQPPPGNQNNNNGSNSHQHKHKHKNGRTKEKGEKHKEKEKEKDGSQPERECTVM